MLMRIHGKRCRNTFIERSTTLAWCIAIVLDSAYTVSCHIVSTCLPYNNPLIKSRVSLVTVDRDTGDIGWPTLVSV